MTIIHHQSFVGANAEVSLTGFGSRAQPYTEALRATMELVANDPVIAASILGGQRGGVIEHLGDDGCDLVPLGVRLQAMVIAEMQGCDPFRPATYTVAVIHTASCATEMRRRERLACTCDPEAVRVIVKRNEAAE